MSPSPAADDLPEDPVETLLAECLGADDIDAAVAAAGAAHPGLAAELQARLAALRRAGLVTAAAPRAVRLGRFVLGARLGGGGMGEVHVAIEQPLGREVAVKLVRPEHLPFAAARERFQREVAVIASLQHPGIVPILEHGECDGVPFYTMPRIHGRSLAECLAGLQARPVPPVPADLGRPAARDHATACCELLAQAARALAHAHGRGVVHRDVKPSNLLLTDDGTLLLIDFGLAKAVDQDSLTRTGVQPGSLAYMSPEQVRGDAVDARSDIWSLGVTLYELLTLRAPFTAATEGATRTAILAGAPPPARLPQGRLSWELQAVLATALAPEREHRYADALALARDLEACAGRRPIAARRPGPWLRLRRFAQRRPAMTTAALLGGLLLVLLPTTLWLQERSARHRIELQARTARTVLGVLTGVFREVEPERARGTTVAARTLLDGAARRLREELGDEPSARAALLEALGTAYLDLGLHEPAAPLLEELAGLRADAHDVDSRLRTLTPLARLAAARGDHAAAERRWREVLALLPRPGEAGGGAAALPSLRLATALWRQDRLDEAEQLFATTVAALRRMHPRDDLALAEAIVAEATFVSVRQDPAEAAPRFAEVRQLLQGLPADDPRRLTFLVEAGRNAQACGQFAAAEDDLRTALAGCQRLFDPRHPLTACAHESLALVRHSRGLARAAATDVAAAIATYRAIYPAPDDSLARALALQAAIAFDLGDMDLATSAADESLSLFELRFPQGSLDFAEALANHCGLLLTIGRTAAAEATGRRACDMAMRLRARNRSHLALARIQLAYVLGFAGHREEADALAADALADAEPLRTPRTRALVRTFAAEIANMSGDGPRALELADAALVDWNAMELTGGIGWARYARGLALATQRRTDEARQELEAAIELLTAVHGAGHPIVANALTGLGEVHTYAGDLPAAETALQTAVAIRRRVRAPDDTNIALPLLNLGAVLHFQGKHAAAWPIAWECESVLADRVERGHRFAVATVRLLTRILDRQPDLATNDSRQRLRRFAEAVLAAEEPLWNDVRRWAP